MRTAPRAIEKAVQFQPETVSSFSQNRCPVWPEYAQPLLPEYIRPIEKLQDNIVQSSFDTT